jgi:hypothetical protein
MLTSMQSTATDFESHDAFLCYAGEDQSAADRLLAQLAWGSSTNGIASTIRPMFLSSGDN